MSTGTKTGEGSVADKGTKKSPFDCIFFWQVVHAFCPIVAWF
jgi:hypothetical protein